MEKAGAHSTQLGVETLQPVQGHRPDCSLRIWRSNDVWHFKVRRTVAPAAEGSKPCGVKPVCQRGGTAWSGASACCRVPAAGIFTAAPATPRCERVRHVTAHADITHGATPRRKCHSAMPEIVPDIRGAAEQDRKGSSAAVSFILQSRPPPLAGPYLCCAAQLRAGQGGVKPTSRCSAGLQLHLGPSAWRGRRQQWRSTAGTAAGAPPAAAAAAPPPPASAASPRTWGAANTFRCNIEQRLGCARGKVCDQVWARSVGGKHDMRQCCMLGQVLPCVLLMPRRNVACGIWVKEGRTGWGSRSRWAPGAAKQGVGNSTICEHEPNPAWGVWKDGLERWGARTGWGRRPRRAPGARRRCAAGRPSPPAAEAAPPARLQTGERLAERILAVCWLIWPAAHGKISSGSGLLQLGLEVICCFAPGCCRQLLTPCLWNGMRQRDAGPCNRRHTSAGISLCKAAQAMSRP